jgi:hypothetical protein
LHQTLWLNFLSKARTEIEEASCVKVPECSGHLNVSSSR